MPQTKVEQLQGLVNETAETLNLPLTARLILRKAMKKMKEEDVVPFADMAIQFCIETAEKLHAMFNEESESDSTGRAITGANG